MKSSGREQLLHAALEHFAEHGVGDRSLRSIATSIGTSHRMLIYHFGSRDGLLTEVVAAVEAAQREALAELTAQPGTAPREVVLRFWATVSAAARRYGPLFYELSAHAMQSRPHAVQRRETLVEPWLAPLTDLMRQAGVPPEEAPVRARISLAVARGLLHDALVTGEFAQADAAVAAFADLVLPAPAAAPRP
ncbi:TetR/AcrR family transcriptional regulator [Pseudonocardia kunmingensis]|uniref:TetR family transcriptional regulator n=1 Tax=Pseudonocardia kunmingensis TaxID=630975 RepID=A0A543E237_9PSEU|nr:TetR/AcrR family transcriptional regulator [Pseudonocardia kunmingensis]TQM15648.1 TetR family transcriptional regulator [Pseudonocardia kunmingensis]